MDEAVVAVRLALARYQSSGSPAELDQAFAAAAAAVATLRGDRAREPAGADEVRRLMARLPEYDRLVTAAVGEAERAAHTGARRLWEWFGLRSEPPTWDESERSGARLLVACACAPITPDGATRLRSRLLRLAAQRWATLLTSQLSTADERTWERALGDRYESVRRRYAPRGKWRSRELRELFASEQSTAVALRNRLTKWLSEDCDFEGLPAEIEAAIVETRTPARMA